MVLGEEVATAEGGRMGTQKLILDATCANRSIWFNKNHPNALYMDVRKEIITGIWKNGGGGRSNE